MSPKARRVVRSVKYFFVFIVLAVVLLSIVTVLSGESLRQLFLPVSEGGMLKDGAWWQMLILFALIALVYPGLVFVKKEVMIEGDFEDHRNTIMKAFESLGYEKTDEDSDKLTFRLRNRFTRFMRAFEDSVTISKGEAPLILEGNLQGDTPSGRPYHLRPARECRDPGLPRRSVRFRGQQDTGYGT